MTDIALTDALQAHTGEILAAERPRQGGYFLVDLLQTERGRFVLKRGHTPEKTAALRHEYAVLEALQAYAPFVPRPMAQAETEDGTGQFLFSYLDGADMAQLIAEANDAGKHRVAAEFGQMLHRLHSWTPDLPRPPDWLSEALAQAADHIASGHVETPLQCHGPWNGADPREALARAQAWRRDTENELVFSHGDYCLPNVLMQRDTATGVIDWSGGGYADRRFDIATARRTLRYNTGLDAFFPSFLEAYGAAPSDEDLLSGEALYILL